jgi:hypothetical protein
MVPSSRKSNRYCRVQTDPDFSTQARDRYVGINPVSYDKHKTIEVRIHSGSINSEKINNWIKLLVSIADAEYVSESPKTLAGVAYKFDLSKALVAYIQERVNQFKGGHGSYSFGTKRVDQALREAA